MGELEPFDKHKLHDWQSVDDWCYCEDCHVDVVKPTEVELDREFERNYGMTRQEYRDRYMQNNRKR